MDGGPEVEYVAVSAAGGIEALKDLFAEVDREGPLTGVAGAVQRAWAAPLRAGAFEVGEAAEMGEDLLHVDLGPQGGKIDTTGSGGGSWFVGFGGRGLVCRVI